MEYVNDLLDIVSNGPADASCVVIDGARSLIKLNAATLAEAIIDACDADDLDPKGKPWNPHPNEFAQARARMFLAEHGYDLIDNIRVLGGAELALLFDRWMTSHRPGWFLPDGITDSNGAISTARDEFKRLASVISVAVSRRICTQTELAQFLGVSQTAVSRWLSGQTPANPGNRLQKFRDFIATLAGKDEYFDSVAA